MRVKCKKKCLWGVHHAWGPEFEIEEGMILGDDMPEETNKADWDAFKHKLIEAGHADHIPDEKVDDKDSDNTDDNTADDESGNSDNSDTSDDNQSDTETDNTDADVEVTAESLKAELETIALEKMDGPMGSDQQAKAELETIGKERYKFDVDKRMSVENIITAIVEAAFKAE